MVTVSLINCLHSYSSLYKDDLGEKAIKPLLKFLQRTNSNYSVNPTPNFSSLSYKSVSLVSYHFRVHEKAWTILAKKFQCVSQYSKREKTYEHKKLRLSTSQVRSVLDSSRTQPSNIGWKAEGPETDCLCESVESVSSSGGVRVGSVGGESRRIL